MGALLTLKSILVRRDKLPRIRLFYDACRINARYFSGSSRTTERVLGHELRFDSYKAFWFCFQEIFVHQTYAVEGNPKRLLDFGAAFGMTALYWRLNHPRASIVSVEPSREYFPLLRKNTRGLHVTLVKAAIGAKKGTAHFTFGSLAGKLSRTGEPVRVLPIDSFLGTGADCMKVDIEGAEYDAIGASKRLSRVKYIIAEIHHGPKKLPVLLRKEGFRVKIDGMMLSAWNGLPRKN